MLKLFKTVTNDEIFSIKEKPLETCLSKNDERLHRLNLLRRLGIITKNIRKFLKLKNK